MTTPYKHNGAFDYYGYHTRDDIAIQMTSPVTMHTGFRFIKQNLKQVEILEFPTWKEYTSTLKKGWDIVGFSFYTCEANEILKMADYARKAGVQQLWAGNYGALNPLISSSFDKVFIGYSEEQIATELGCEIGEIIHPPIIEGIGIKPLGYPFILMGVLYTTRGCPMKCTFCQTPAFANTAVKIPIDSIERVLRHYKDNGVQLVIIYDDNFGIIPSHAREVVDLFQKYNISWGVITRADILKKNFDEWYESGLVGVSIGIESMNPDILKDVKKQETLEDTMEVLELLNSHNCFIVGGYMIGFEQETKESIKDSFRQLSRLKPDFLKIFVATPFPQTELWDTIQQDYGIDTSDWSKFDLKHLVWNHPSLTEEDIHMLLDYGHDLFNSEEHVFRFIRKLKHRLKKQKGHLATHQFFLSSFKNRLHSEVGGLHFFD